VLYFWNEVFSRLKKNVISLVGNHDLAAESGDPKIHALVAHKGKITIVEEPITTTGILLMPYRSDKNLFIKECKKHAAGTNTIICHQSFDGAQFDNGWYDPSGIDLSYIHQNNIISGHIHKPQTFSKVQYVGAPRWRSVSDANMDRHIWLFELDNNGNILKRTPYSTGDVCRQIKHVIDTPESPFDLNLFNTKDDWRVDIKGPESYIEKRKKELQRPGLKIRTIKTEQTKIYVKESDGIKVAFGKYLDKYIPKYGTPKGILTELAIERVGLQ
jgi:DNA repair exonuclease SbcCD nuclease subunit